MMPTARPIVYHFLSVCWLIAIFVIVTWFNFRWTPRAPEEFQSRPIAYIVVLLTLPLRIMPLPWAICNLIGILMLNPFPPKPTLLVAKELVPKLCFRVVTRGMFPNLVRENTVRNMAVCHKVGLEKFCFEIVTDNTVNVKETNNLREIVVPTDYVTPNKTLYKARALHYCLEPGVDRLTDADWVVHLDEETILTKSAVIGLMNAAGLDKCDIGTGLITYCSLGVVNWLTTLAENMRVGLDMGLQRFSFEHLGAPVFGMKGSFLLVKNTAETYIGFDFGPKGSITEDCMFAMTAWKYGFRFNFIEGEMLEKGAFTVMDFIEQRSRWYVGRYFVLSSRKIPCRCKLFLIPSFISVTAFPVLTVSTIVSWVIEYRPFWFIQIGLVIISTNALFLTSIGSIISNRRTKGVPLRCLYLLLAFASLPITGTMESIASTYSLFKGRWIDFQIVQKEERNSNNNIQTV